MSTKFHPIAQEFLHLKSKRFKSIEFIKVDAHQDDLKSFDNLSFFKQLNVKCNVRAKELILKVSEDLIILFPLELSSLHVSIASNHLILNYAQDIQMHTHLLKCEHCLTRTLKIYDVRTINWLLRSTIIKGVQKHLQIWLSKSLLNFAGAAHQLHYQKL